MSAAPSPSWTRDPDTHEHFLPVDADRSMKVYRTGAGDYAITCHRESFGHGGEVDSRPTLAAAKTFAENLVATGRFVELEPQ